ncbi:MAG: hypothetical protein ACR2G3_00650 [Solirubrobacterales bacterium]
MGEVTKEEFRRLRDEVRETRDLAQAVLLALVGTDRALTWKIEARVERHMDAEKAGRPLREVIGYDKARRIWDEFEVAAVRGLQRLHREDVAAIRGIGSGTLIRLDHELAEHGVAWGAMARGAA